MSKKKEPRKIELLGPVMPPDKDKLVAGLEEREKCPKCQGKVRAMILDGNWTGGTADDAEFLVKLYCPGSGCGWDSTMWRPWKRGERDVI